MKKRFLAPVFSIVAIVMQWTRPTSAETTLSAPDDAPIVEEVKLVERWLRSSSEVAAWRAQVGAARFEVVTAELLPNPEVSVSGLFLLSGVSPDGETGVQGQLTVPLPIFGQMPARRRAAEALVSVAEVAVLQMLWERISDLHAAMVDVAFADARVQVYERNLAELSRLRRLVEARAQAGANDAYDVLRVTTAETTMRASMQTAMTERAQAEAHLHALMAVPTLTRVRITKDGLARFRGPEDERTLVRVALERRPDLALLRRNVVASNRAAERHRKESIPTPSVFAGIYAVQRAYGVLGSAGISMPLPLFDRNQGEVGRALLQAQASELAASALEARIEAEVRGASSAREAARVALRDHRDSALPSNAELLRRAEVSYQAAKFSIAELFDAYRTMWEARAQELELERQLAVAEARLMRATALVPIDLARFERGHEARPGTEPTLGTP